MKHDLISRKALLEAYDKAHQGSPGGARKLIEEAPGVDAMEVVHGRWIWDEENECWVCSNCEDSALNNYRWQSVDSNYCPNCGATMDGKEVEGE